MPFPTKSVALFLSRLLCHLLFPLRKITEGERNQPMSSEETILGAINLNLIATPLLLQTVFGHLLITEIIILATALFQVSFSYEMKWQKNKAHFLHLLCTCTLLKSLSISKCVNKIAILHQRDSQFVSINKLTSSSYFLQNGVFPLTANEQQSPPGNLRPVISCSFFFV